MNQRAQLEPPGAPLDLSTPARYHVVGVGGPGMSALAHVLVGMGHRVSGSDMRESEALDRLRDAGVHVHLGHDESLVRSVDAVTYSTAIPLTNIEIVAAERDGTPVMHRAGMLASICAQATAIGVAGTHGKTTTTSLLATVLDEAGLNPSFVIGGDATRFASGARWTGSPWLVVESDESDKTHLALPLHATILTNVEADHLENWGTFEAIVDGFGRYLAQIPGPKVLCVDDERNAEFARGLGSDRNVVTYALHACADYTAQHVRATDRGMEFTVHGPAFEPVAVRLPLHGVHNVANALAVFAMARSAVGMEPDTIVRGLESFTGVARRFDHRGSHNGATLIDDYAHIPTEIAAVLSAARAGVARGHRIVAVFQPNRFRRMAVLSPEYRDAFIDADVVVLTEIYPSGDAPIPGVTGKLVVDAVLDAHPRQQVVWMPDRDDLIEYLVAALQPGDVCISMGCGDIADLPNEILRRGAERAGRA